MSMTHLQNQHNRHAMLKYRFLKCDLLLSAKMPSQFTHEKCYKYTSYVAHHEELEEVPFIRVEKSNLPAN